MESRSAHTRRDFILAGTVSGGGLLLTAFPQIARAMETSPDKAQNEKAKTAEDVSPAEDLMREHGLFERILLIYEDAMRRINEKKEIDHIRLADTAKIVRSFVEDYHSKLEEDQVFPRFEKAGKLVDLVKVLREQHQAGRMLTDRILQLTASATGLDEKGKQQLANAMGQFIRMYRPHLAREDTILFPAMHAMISPEDYDILGDQFEDREHKLFGENGFEKVVDEIAKIEKPLDIYELSKFTPKQE